MTAETRVMLQVRDLSKSFGGVMAVNNISFELNRGEILGVIGPNGSGKTTLANLTTGFVKKDSGHVYLNGIDISRWATHRIADAGLVRTFQIMRPYRSLPAYKNLIPALFSPRSKREGDGKLGDRNTLAIDLLEDVGFDKAANVPFKPAGSLPLGYLKRLELARCIAMNPKIIICDEVFSGLSQAEIVSSVPLFERLRSGGIGLIMIEHRLQELFKLAARVIVLNFGSKIADGPPEEVMKQKEVRSAYLGEEVEL